MARIKLLVEYDGSAYHGYQLQINADTIQQEIMKAVSALTGDETTVYAAGRTDAGVHALGQVIAFDTVSRIPPDRWKYALNSMLPRDIRVLQSELAADSFHPRFDALRKRYIYRIYRQNAGATFYRHYAWCNEEDLDVNAMQEACCYIEGCHDFSSFCSSGSSVKEFTREVYCCKLKNEFPFLNLYIEANGFLYNMVRIIMGTLMEVGRGVYSPGYVKQIRDARDRNLAGPTAPPQGLYLAYVDYDKQG